MNTATAQKLIGLHMRDREMRAVLLMLSVLILTVIHRQALDVAALPASGLLEDITARVWLYFLGTLLLFGAVPVMLVRRYWRARLSDVGIRLGDWKFGGAAVAVLLPVIAVTLLLPASGMEDMRNTYPVDKSAITSAGAFTVYALGRVFLFYVGWEILFRGYLLFGLRRDLGDCAAICIQTIPSALWHIGYPTGELYMSIAAGILFGWLALRTSSILWPFLLHAGIGIITDLSITLSPEVLS